MKILSTHINKLQVGDQDMNHWRNQAAHVPDALRRYYLSFLASTVDAAEVTVLPTSSFV